MGAAVDEEGTSPADTLAAIVVERHRAAALAAPLNGNRIAALADQLLVQDVQHFEERSVFFDSGHVIGLEMTLILGVFLTPYLQIKIHCR